MPYDHLMKRDSEALPRSIETYCQEMVSALNDAWSNARLTMQETVRERDWKLPIVQTEVRVPRYEVGEEVLLLRPRKYLKSASRKPDKLNVPVWSGPYRVTQRISELVYEIDKAGRRDMVHVDRLRKYRSRGQDAPRSAW